MIYTLGHSTLSPEDFIAAARGADCPDIIDVRSHPGSRKLPHFNRESMERWIPAMSDGDMAYEWWPALGGWTEAHLHDSALVAAMAQRGVAIEAYAQRAFPRQRIGVPRPDPAPLPLDPEDGPGLPGTPRPAWTNQGLYDYQWFMSLPEFMQAIDWLVREFDNPTKDCAMVCAEALWWKCHRSMIADYLHWRGAQCFHLPSVPPKRSTTPRYKRHPIGDRLARYEPEVVAAWKGWGR
jgi:hypothetical protein